MLQYHGVFTQARVGPEDVSVAKILVADDNSNIQKMVTLALKDQGIDVVAVGNGEAAVRKISDIRPDLVLADVFMPVRNGYEVCKYVKDDAALSHIPVILLVGAFDPLDEQEAQRVGADGVLKKPFVPPDPLISMVKSALARAGVSLEAEKVPTPAAETSFPAANLLIPPVGGRLGSSDNVPVLAAVPKQPAFEEDIPAGPAALKIEAGGQPLAFSSLLETPAQEEDPAFMPTAHTDLGAERDWRSEDNEEDESEEEEAPGKSSWRRDAADESFVDEVPAVQGDWRENAGESAPGRSSSHWTPTREKQDLSELASAPETELETKAPPVAPFSGDAWAAAISAGSDEKTAAPEGVMLAPEVSVPATVPAQEAPIEPPSVESKVEAPIVEPPEHGETAVAQPEKQINQWFSSVSSPWDAEARKASQLASAWDVPAPIAVKEIAPASNGTADSGYSGEAQIASPEPESVSESREAEKPASDIAQSHPLEAAQEESGGTISAEAVETIREEVTQIVEPEPATVQESSAWSNAQTAQPEAVTDMDAIVAKVLAKMSPEILQAVTREILKPVVEAIVRNELSTKKS
jgi:CheY-like chemotaxis protein